MSRIFLIIALIFTIFGQYHATESENKNSTTRLFDYEEYEDESNQKAVSNRAGVAEEKIVDENDARIFSTGEGCPSSYTKIRNQCKKVIRSE